MQIELSVCYSDIGEPGEIGPAGYDGPVGQRGLVGEVIPVRY